MTEKQLCRDCKHLKHDSGCGIWCGVGGNNRNYDCPKFEKDDWVSPQTMTEKRFWLVPLDYYGEQRFVRDNNLIGEKSMSNKEVVDLLNNLSEENEELEQRIRNKDCLIQQLRTALNTDYYKESQKYKKEFIRVCEELAEENELYRKLEKENKQLKQIISKIDFAIIRKYDNSLENLLDEVYDNEYNNWIKKQVLRAKKLGDDLK